jgi:uncharacterized protein YecT (DUF1311 family)
VRDNVRETTVGRGLPSRPSKEGLKVGKTFLKFVLAILFVSLLIVPCAVHCQDQMQMNDDAAQRLDLVDKRLNVAFQQVLKKYAANADFIAKLRKAEQNWIVYRDAYLGSIFPHYAAPLNEADSSYYGSVFPMCRSIWLATITDARTKQLKEFLAGPKATLAGQSEYKQQDQLMNTLYQRVLKSYEPKYAGAFRKAQVAWLGFRDAEADAFSALAAATNVENTRVGKLAARTAERNSELKQWISGVEEGDVCAGSLPVR